MMKTVDEEQKAADVKLRAPMEVIRQRAMNGHRRRIAEIEYRFERERRESLIDAMTYFIVFAFSQ